uniref:helix-turn-helix domain-containing protein n=1 Tax=Collinsella vaginalis TaxID=1870987 RepID=UPI00117C569C
GNGVNTAAMPGPGGPYVTDRGRQAIAYLAEHGTCGPTELAAAFGSSNATWSRELEALTTAGLVTKVGQKRILTDMGRLWLQQQAGQ